jgi:hypothetical protein
MDISLEAWRSIRTFVRHPSQWVVAAVCGLAVGASVAVGIVLRTVVMEPVRPVGDLDRIVTIGGIASGASVGDPLKWWGRAASLEKLTAYRVGDTTLGAGDAGEWVRAAEVSVDFFRVLGLTTDRGRGFEADDVSNARQVVVVSQAVWTRLERLGPPMTQSIRLGGVDYNVIGLAPKPLTFPADTAYWILNPLGATPQVSFMDGAGEMPGLPVAKQYGWIGRLRPGSSVAQLTGEMEALLTATERELSSKTGLRYGTVVQVRLLSDALLGPVRSTLRMATAGTVCLLAAALVHLFAYSIGRVVGRRQELDIRVTLGASSSRINALLLLDASILAAASGIIAAFAAYYSLTAARLLLLQAGVSMSVGSGWLWAGAAALGLSMACAATAAKAGTRGLLKQTEFSTLKSRSTAQGVLGFRTRTVLLSATTALAFPLVLGAASTTATFVERTDSSRGFEANGRLLAQVRLERRATVGPQLSLLQTRILDRVRQVEGVTEAAFVSQLPFTKQDRRFVQVSANGSIRPLAGNVEVTPGSLAPLGIRVIRGTSTMPSDRSGVVVNTVLAKLLWNDADPLGQTLDLQKTRYRVIGVVTPTQTFDEDRDVAELYRPFVDVSPSGQPTMMINLLIQCGSSCTAIAPVVNGILESEGASAVSSGPFLDSVRRASGSLRTRTIVWIAYATLALGVSLIGLASLVAYNVRVRRFEIAVRAALGATPFRIVIGLTREVLLFAASGVILGATASRLGARLFEQIFGSAAFPSLQMLASVGGALLVAMLLGAIVPVALALRRSPRLSQDLRFG